MAFRLGRAFQLRFLKISLIDLVHSVCVWIFQMWQWVYYVYNVYNSLYQRRKNDIRANYFKCSELMSGHRKLKNSVSRGKKVMDIAWPFSSYYHSAAPRLHATNIATPSNALSTLLLLLSSPCWSALGCLGSDQLVWRNSTIWLSSLFMKFKMQNRQCILWEIKLQAKVLSALSWRGKGGAEGAAAPPSSRQGNINKGVTHFYRLHIY